MPPTLSYKCVLNNMQNIRLTITEYVIWNIYTTFVALNLKLVLSNKWNIIKYPPQILMTPMATWSHPVGISDSQFDSKQNIDLKQILHFNKHFITTEAV